MKRLSLVVSLLVLCLTGCRTSDPVPASDWPPPGFELRFSDYGVIGSVWRELSSFLLTRDGLAVYREANRFLEADFESSVGDASTADPVFSFPVFDTLCAYRLQPESVRFVSRQLYFARVHELFELEAPIDPVPMVALTLSQEGVDRTAFLYDDMPGLASRVLQVLNALLPARSGLNVQIHSDAPGDRPLLYVPEPRSDLIGSLKFHLELLEQRPLDRDLLVETCTLAIAHKDRATVDALLSRLLNLPEPDPEISPGGIKGVVEQLRRLRP